MWKGGLVSKSDDQLRAFGAPVLQEALDGLLVLQQENEVDWAMSWEAVWFQLRLPRISRSLWNQRLVQAKMKHWRNEWRCAFLSFCQLESFPLKRFSLALHRFTLSSALKWPDGCHLWGLACLFGQCPKLIDCIHSDAMAMYARQVKTTHCSKEAGESQEIHRNTCKAKISNTFRWVCSLRPPVLAIEESWLWYLDREI